MAKNAQKFCIIVVFCFTAVMVSGCSGPSGELEKVKISGKVTYQGKPVEDGEIRLIPINETKGPASTAKIISGEYAITGRGGAVVGTHRVEIQAYMPVPGAKPYTAEQADGQWDIKAGDLPKRQIIPYQYNRQSMLEVNTEPGQRSITKDFDLR